jgi:hypothetical protein
VHQPCTKTYTININHIYQHHTMYQSCISQTCVIPCANTTPCINNVSQPYTISLMICLNHSIHHVPYDIPSKYYQWCTSTKITKRCISYMCYHMPQTTCKSSIDHVLQTCAITRTYTISSMKCLKVHMLPYNKCIPQPCTNIPKI